MGDCIQIWRILGHKFGEFGSTILEEIVGEIERQIFHMTPWTGVFSIGEKIW